MYLNSGLSALDDKICQKKACGWPFMMNYVHMVFSSVEQMHFATICIFSWQKTARWEMKRRVNKFIEDSHYATELKKVVAHACLLQEIMHFSQDF